MTDGSRKLLIIDDDTIVRQSVVAYLEDSGFHVLEAGDGPSGLEAFRRYNPDLVITDLRMPGMDGLQVLKEIHEQNPDIPVIVISGAGVMGDVVEALRLGASDYMIKPIVDMEMLVHSVSKTLERQELRAENLRYREELEAANRDLKEHLRALERDQQSGRQVQQRLMPPPSAHKGGYTISRYILPSLYLSGDFIDYAYNSNRYMAFYLADVSGHGASSAFVTIWLKHLVNWMVRDEGLFCTQASFESGPNEMLQEINSELHDSRLNHHLTLFVGVIDTLTHRMHYAVGGHLPMPVLVTPNGARFLEGKGKPVGIFKDIEWKVYELELPERFMLASFSDGMLETLPPEGLCEKEAYLLDLLSKEGASNGALYTEQGCMDSLCQLLSLDKVHEAPDDIAILTVAKS